MTGVKAVTIKACEGTSLAALAATETAVVTLPEGEGGTLRGLQAAVGGYVDCFDVIHPETEALATFWFHDEGKVIGLGVNTLANVVAAWGGWPGAEFGDWVAGDVVVTGFDPKEGETIDVPDEWVEWIEATLDQANFVLAMTEQNERDKQD